MAFPAGQAPRSHPLRLGRRGDRRCGHPPSASSSADTAVIGGRPRSSMNGWRGRSVEVWNQGPAPVGKEACRCLVAPDWKQLMMVGAGGEVTAGCHVFLASISNTCKWRLCLGTQSVWRLTGARPRPAGRAHVAVVSPLTPRREREGLSTLDKTKKQTKRRLGRGHPKIEAHNDEQSTGAHRFKSDEAVPWVRGPKWYSCFPWVLASAQCLCLAVSRPS
ncbi:hypothetical protein VTG60DRAFT_6376 [Thermothelomyces hinnuleus]